MDKRDFFNRWAPVYDVWLPSVFYQAVHVRLLEYVELPVNAHVLEVGCGTGKLLNRLAQCWPTLSGMGLDFSGEMVAQAGKRTPHRDRLQFFEGNVTALPFESQSFDAVFCCISFLHYPDPVAALQAISQVLKPCGHVYLADFTPPAWLGQDILHRGISPEGVTFYSATARAALGVQAGWQCDHHVYLLGPVMMTQFSPLLAQT
ncbi:MAG: class I SAM-dependent methyltransferase [Cyanobacteria bacterium P01_D01_bin.6]